MTDTSLSNSQNNISEDEIDLAEYAKVIWQWRYFTAGLILVSLTFTFVYTLLMEPLYIAKTTLLPTKSSSVNMGAMSGLVSSFGLSVPVEDDPSAVYENILLSRTFLSEFINDTLPAKNYPEGRPVKDIMEIKAPDSSNAAITLAGELEPLIEYKKEKNVYMLSVTSSDSVFSAALANRLVEKLEEFNNEKRILKIRNNRKFIEQRLFETEKDLRVARRRLTTFRKQNMRLDVSRAPQLLDKQEWLLQEVKAKQEIYIMLRKELEMAKIEEEKEKPYVQVLDNAIPPNPTYKPAKKLLLAVSVVLGLFTGIFMSFIFEYIYKNKLSPKLILSLEKIRQ